MVSLFMISYSFYTIADTILILIFLGKIVLPNRNNGKIKSGQKVLIKLDNYPYQESRIILEKYICLSADYHDNYYVEVKFSQALKTTYWKYI